MPLQATAKPPALATIRHGARSSMLVRLAVTCLVLCVAPFGRLAHRLAGDEVRPADAANRAAAVNKADDARTGRADSAGDEFEIVSLSGKVVWWGEALAERLGVSVVPEAAERTLALQTDDRQLIPLIEDLRGRAFRRDERLREMHVELRARRYRATPALQILTVFEIADGQRYEVDYWCDICAIPMFETGPCACCQQDNRLRKRKVDPPPETANR